MGDAESRAGPAACRCEVPADVESLAECRGARQLEASAGTFSDVRSRRSLGSLRCVEVRAARLALSTLYSAGGLFHAVAHDLRELDPLPLTGNADADRARSWICGLVVGRDDDPSESG